MVESPRLLVSLPESDDLQRAVEGAIPGVSIAFVRPTDPGPWATVEAWLVGSPDRELPGWAADRTPRLGFVQRLYTGLDDFPFERFPPAISIAGNVGAYAPFVAEHAVALLLATGHHVLQNVDRVRTGRLRPPLSNDYLTDRTVLILGFGEIGRAVAERLLPFGPRLEACSRHGATAPGLAAIHPPESLADAAAGADVLVDCRPLTKATRGTIDAALLARCRPEAIYVNVGRAACADEAALFAHLKSHPRFRAAIDVWWEEDYAGGRLGLRFPFPELPNFLGSPHVAGVGGAPRQRALVLATENLARFFRGEPPRHVADRADYR